MEMHGMTDEQKDATIASIQSFVSGSPEGVATLVLMGDSTMSGIVTELLNITEEVQNSMELIYVSNDRTRSVRYGCNEACGGVPPGGEWKDLTLLTDSMTKDTVARAEKSTNALHAQGCQSGGGLETYVFRSGPYKNLVVHHWGFLPEYSDFCWKPCMVDAMAALEATAVVWNIGFHLLNHDFKPSVCQTRHNPTKPGCGNYKDMVQTASSQMLSAGVGAVIWKHTNWLCEARQRVGFPETAEPLDRWHDLSKRTDLEHQCEQDCPQYKAAGMTCFDWFFDSHTTARMYEESREAMQELKANWGNESVHELDSYAITRDCCNAGCEGETQDGEHYAGLDSEITVQLGYIVRRLGQNGIAKRR